MKRAARFLSLALAAALTVFCLPILSASAATANIAVDGATLTLDNNIGITFFVASSKLSGYDSSYMTVVFPHRDGTPDTFTLTPTARTLNGVSYNAYYFDRIAPDDMGTRVTAQLHAVKGATTYDANNYAYAVTDYILNMAGSTHSLDALMADVLAYGKAAEAYTGRSSIPDSDTITTLLAKASADTVANTAASNALRRSYPTGVSGRSEAMTFSSVGLNLRDSAALRYTFAPTAGKDAGDYSLKISVEGHEDEIVPLASGQADYRYRGLSATETDKIVRAVFIDGSGSPVSAYLDYSVESYAYYCYQNRASDAPLNDLTQALIRYSGAIVAYGNAPFELPFHKGVNLSGLESGAYSSSIFSGNAYLGNDSTYTVIKSKGFDHVRLPVDLRNYYNAGTKTLTSGISNLDMILDKIEAAGLYCFLDFHGWYNLDTSVASQKETFLTIWRLIAERYQNRSDKLCFELINEPHHTEDGGNLDSANLNALQAEVIPLIRQTNPDRIILAAAAEWNGAWTLKDMVLPTDDGHLAIVCHTYSPLAFTHQGASWAGYGNDQVHFSVDDKTATGTKDLDNAFIWIRQWKERTGIPVILDEFGVNTNSQADHGEITAWLTYVTDKCEANDVSWTYWEFNKSFGVYQNNKWVDYILEGLGLN